MSEEKQALDLFSKGFTVKQIRERTGFGQTALTEILSRSGQRPQASPSITYQVRACPFFDSCRDCTFLGCALDRFKVVTV